MNITSSFLISILITVFVAQAQARKVTTWNQQLKLRVQKLIKKSGIKNENLGLVITYGVNGENKDLLRINDKEKFIPASLTKIITAGAALEKFPMGHKFVTQLSSPGKVKDGVLKGDLYLVGGGDAGFISESMWNLVNEFVRAEITSIEGDIVVDDSRFDKVRFDPGREPSRVDRAYDAPIGAMTFNWSSVNVFVRPGTKIGDPLKVFADPTSSYIKVVNSGVTKRKGRKRDVKVSRKISDREPSTKGDTIFVSGHLGPNTEEVVKYKNISRPDIWSGYHLREFLSRRGIKVSGKIKNGVVPKNSKVLSDTDSSPVSAAVADMMKFSNNYIAEILTKNLSAELKGTPATMESGMKILKKYIKELGIAKENYVMTNPSGLSRKNKFRPNDLHMILEHLKTKFTAYPEMLSSMPISGVDGTLEKRMHKTSARGWVRAKTGQLRGVAGLAGYAGRKDGRTFTFTFLFNGRNKDVAKAKDLYDNIATALVQ